MVEKTCDPWCCGCIKLRTGCLIISYVRLVVEISLPYFIMTTRLEQFEGMSERIKEVFFLIGLLMLLFLLLSILACIKLLVALHTNDYDYVAGYGKYAWACIFITLTFGILFWRISFICFILLLLQGYSLQMLNSYCDSMVEKHQPATTVVVPVAAPATPAVPLRCSDA